LPRKASASLNRRGYHGTSLDEWARRLSVTKAALPFCFPSKQAMLEARFDRATAIDAFHA
jgi:AcrR family transcriptional regulator